MNPFVSVPRKANWLRFAAANDQVGAGKTNPLFIGNSIWSALPICNSTPPRFALNKPGKSLDLDCQKNEANPRVFF